MGNTLKLLDHLTNKTSTVSRLTGANNTNSTIHLILNLPQAHRLKQENLHLIKKYLAINSGEHFLLKTVTFTHVTSVTSTTSGIEIGCCTCERITENERFYGSRRCEHLEKIRKMIDLL